VDEPRSVDEAIEANRANWDERVSSHLLAYDVEGFIADSARLSGTVRDDYAVMAPHLAGRSVAGLSLLHLQCHIGTDTLSWARLGATVTGIDFSPEATAAARQIASRAGITARFIDSDVDSAAIACNAQFDVVYTGNGALMWLPDLARWAGTVAALLRPGGLFYIRDVHPVLQAVDDQRDDGALVLTAPYFGTGHAQTYADATTYADAEVRLTNVTTYEWPHPLSDIIQSLLNAGLRLTSFLEHQTVGWQALPQLTRLSGGWALPEQRERLPLAYSLTATRDALES